MSRVIAVANQKGGVGKTTTAINLSCFLAAAERKTLLVDIDPQANASSGLGITADKRDKTIYEVLIENLNPQEIIHDTSLEHLKLIPSDIKLVGAEIELVPVESREHVLRRSLQQIRHDFDYVIMDCPPSLSLLTLNGLTAADSVLIPIQCEYYALEGISQLLNTVRLVQKHLNNRLEIEGVLLTMFDSRLNLSKQVSEDVKKFFNDKVFESVIYRNVKLSEAPSFGQPIIFHDITSRGAQNYLSLAQEIIENE
ncbi:sporulation initiation inhibitor Soj [candidate division LCP-89 bacterium B3_LCP]|uniref:Sporulation initiation inhibitor Soj n=1 Tax=candidate division LCP-89 bacterium B3_LCP TaxID=2012998 RepID=A0A532V4Y1_UNCL8|nr:MAG: sporulation initiation inhibitor Soj [candidate division LCP-89 bacterium B3_LCP]